MNVVDADDEGNRRQERVNLCRRFSIALIFDMWLAYALWLYERNSLSENGGKALALAHDFQGFNRRPEGNLHVYCLQEKSTNR